MHAIIIALSGGFWAFFGAQGFEGRYGSLPLLVDLIIVLALAAAGWMLVQAARQLPQAGVTRFQTRFRTYLLIVRLEYSAIILTVILGNVLQQQNPIMPIIALIVGIHFFALVNILQRIPSIIKGALLCLTAIITVVLWADPLWLWVGDIACALAAKRLLTSTAQLARVVAVREPRVETPYVR